jgi:hypothetical protein
MVPTHVRSGTWLSTNRRSAPHRTLRRHFRQSQKLELALTMLTKSDILSNDGNAPKSQSHSSPVGLVLMTYLKLIRAN